MCVPIVVQFCLLENLLVALTSGSPVHIHRTAPRVLPASAGTGNWRNVGKRLVWLGRTNVLKSQNGQTN